MTGPEIRLGVDAEGNVNTWKIVVGAKKSHRLSSPLFPLHQPNYDFDKGVLMRVKRAFHPGSTVALDEEYARRKNLGLRP